MDRFTRIKSGELGLAPSSRIIKADDFSTAHDARAILDEARAEAARIVADAKQVYEEERKRGFDEGSEQAKLEMAERMIDAVGSVVDYLGTVEHDMVEVVGRAMERILGEISDKEIIVRVVKNALAAVRNEKHLTLRVAPDQVATVKDHMNEILALYPIIVDVQVMGDGRLGKSGCILESEIGVIDASLDGQIEALKRSFERMFGERRQA
jgi:type III secretion protein L